MAHASHGSVHDIITFKRSSMTWDLRVSLITDISAGLMAIHASPIGIFAESLSLDLSSQMSSQMYYRQSKNFHTITIGFHASDGSYSVFFFVGWHGQLTSFVCVVDGRWVCKITDFGLPNLRQCSRDDSNDSFDSLLWTAPEVLRNEKSPDKQKIDLYSFGIICQELVSCEVPFGDNNSVTAEEIVQRVKIPTEPPFRPKPGNVLIISFLISRQY
jgi:serine/threonine protein kinase